MARPKPNVLLEFPNKETHKIEQILEADAVYAVFYKGKPINVRMISNVVSYPGPKYRKCVFPNAGFACNLAERLNKQYNCEDFKVHKLVAGEQYDQPNGKI